jgi:putative nucleotidyltransferase with HDIG domain
MAQDDGDLIRLAFDTLPDSAVVTNARGLIVALNAAARTLRGSRPLNNAEFPLLFDSAPTVDTLRGIEEVRSGDLSEFSVLEGDPASGRVFEHHLLPMKSPNGSFAGTVLSSRDVTARQQEDVRQNARVSSLQSQVTDLQDVLNERFVDGMITLVNALEARDQYTCGHSSRVALIAGTVARAVLSDARDAAEIELAARLHDIGKVAVPDHLVDKPTRLTPDEVALMDTHPLLGETILRPITQLHHVADIIRNHHERWDGSGYPDGLTGERIPVGSRILALADTFDAMTSRRPYRQALSVGDARREIAGHLNSQFDPSIGSIFLGLMSAGEILSERQLSSNGL